MTYDHWKHLTPRQKAKWPATAKAYLRPQDQVTINLDADLAEWLVETIVGQSSLSSDLEETVTTALRVVRGDLSLDTLHHLQRLAQARRGPISKPVSRQGSPRTNTRDKITDLPQACHKLKKTKPEK